MSEPLYQEAGPSAAPRKQLLLTRGPGEGRTFPFTERIEIGRSYEGRPPLPGVLLLPDPRVSSRHCVIRQSLDGRCVIRDVSRNGTRVDGRRLVPNLETDLKVGQAVTVGTIFEFHLVGDPSARGPIGPAPPVTAEAAEISMVTVLVGDIRGFTSLMRRADFPAIQAPVNRLFERLHRKVEELGGAVKEYQGDAIFAFWEAGPERDYVADACEAALEMDHEVRRIADDPEIWSVPDFPLHMDWALVTGPVAIHNLGGDHPAALSMVGKTVVLAFRLEKIADDETGSILACPATRELAPGFVFRDLGDRILEGFDVPVRPFALLGPRSPADVG